MTEPLLITSNMNAYYGPSHILRGIDLHVHPAERVVVAGPSGAGKTTLLKSVLGLTQVTRSGSIVFNGRETVKKKTHQITALGIGYVPQGRLPFPSMTVAEHLRFAWHKSGKKLPWTPEVVYGLFPELKARARVSGTHLSGGEQQMMAIGQALVANPTLLLLDEPSEGLSVFVIERIEAVCRHLSAQGMAILLVEQNLDMARALADRVYFFVNGQVERESDGDACRSEVSP